MESEVNKTNNVTSSGGKLNGINAQITVNNNNTVHRVFFPKEHVESDGKCIFYKPITYLYIFATYAGLLGFIPYAILSSRAWLVEHHVFITFQET